MSAREGRLIACPLSEVDLEHDVVVFQLVDMNNPSSNHPIRFGDPVWFWVRFFLLPSFSSPLKHDYSRFARTTPTTWTGEVALS